jgi:hypothetical protein
MDNIKKLCLMFEPVGSRVTCNPAPTDTDEDFLCLIKLEDFNKLEETLYEDKYTRDGSIIIDEQTGLNQGGFVSYKSGDTNLIVTSSAEFFRRFMAASSVAKKLNLLDKNDRIDLFQATLYGNSCDGKNYNYTEELWF